jgi:hypothetical protein
MTPTANDNVPRLIFSNTTVLTLSELAHCEGQACKFMLTIIHPNSNLSLLC